MTDSGTDSRTRPNNEDRGLIPRLAEIFATADSETSWFLDRARHRIVVVRGGQTNVPHLDADEVEDDEARFELVPPITTADEFEWMVEFVADRDDPVIANLLDMKRGANARFVKRLTKRHPEVLAAWQAYRTEQLEALAAEWLESLELGAPRELDSGG